MPSNDRAYSRERALQVRDAVIEIYADQLGARETDRRIADRLGIRPASVRTAIRDSQASLGPEWVGVPDRASISPPLTPGPKANKYPPEEVVRLVDEEGLKAAELAERWGVKPSSARSIITIARRKLDDTRLPRRHTTEPELAEIEQAIGPLEGWRQQCHAASLELVRSGLIDGRVARGWCRLTPGVQHSWVVLHPDPYSRRARVLDVTAWSYNENLPRVILMRNLEYHRPHGLGHYHQAPRPRAAGGPTIVLRARLTQAARDFLNQFGPLDARGWSMVANLPVQGWPSQEIIGAMLNQKNLAALVPIDIAGMLTNRNPQRLYLRDRN